MDVVPGVGGADGYPQSELWTHWPSMAVTWARSK